MAGINIGNEKDEKKFSTSRPAEEGYEFTVGGVTPTKVHAGKETASAGNAGNTGNGTNTGTAAPASSGNSTNAGEIMPGISVSGRGSVSTAAPVRTSVSGASAAKEPEPTYAEKAETSLGELADRYSAQLREQYNYNAEKLREERDAALRENWILQQQAKAALPEQMAAAGINGGAGETSLANLIAQYQNQRNDIRGDYADSLGELGRENAAAAAQNQQSLNDRWLDYLLSLAKAEAAAEIG